jgi:hypothetical protein
MRVLVIGGVLAFGAAILWRRTGTETMGLGGIFVWVQSLSVSLIFLAGPFLTRLLNREVRFQNLDTQTKESANLQLTPAIPCYFSWVLAVAVFAAKAPSILPIFFTGIKDYSNVVPRKIV